MSTLLAVLQQSKEIIGLKNKEEKSIRANTKMLKMMKCLCRRQKAQPPLPFSVNKIWITMLMVVMKGVSHHNPSDRLYLLPFLHGIFIRSQHPTGFLELYDSYVSPTCPQEPLKHMFL